MYFTHTIYFDLLGGEAYLPMTPGSSTSNVDADSLRPAKVISYLSDDSMPGEFHKRSFSVGSRPPSKSKRHYANVPDTQPEQKVSDNGRCASAPHLIVQKMKGHQSPYVNESKGHQNPYVNESSLSCSPMSQSIKSEFSDTDSLMEMDFYRPRTASDSFGCRPRASSFNKVLSQQRQRSSSYGQQSKLAQLAHDVRKKLGSFESVRISKDQPTRTSTGSIGRLSTSSKASSSESLRNSSKNSGYVEMHLEKRLDDGYLDMTIGSKIGSSGKSVGEHSRSSSNQSLSSSPAVSGIASPNRHDSLSPHPSTGVVKASSEHTVQKPSSSAAGQGKFLSSGSSRSVGKSPGGSGRESEEESYVPYAPGNSSAKSSKSEKKKDKGSVKDKKGRISPKVSVSGKQSPKNSAHQQEKDGEYIGYAPGDVTTDKSEKVERRPSVERRGEQRSYSEKKTEQRSKPAESDYMQCDVGAGASSSAQTPESEYVDCDGLGGKADVGPSHVRAGSFDIGSHLHVRAGSLDKTSHHHIRTGSLDKSSLYHSPEERIGKERKISGDSNSKAGKSSNPERKISSEYKSGTLSRSGSSSKSLESEDVLAGKRSSSKSPDQQEASAKAGYAYMEYDPSNPPKESTEEVKSPTRVRSFIATTSMEEDLQEKVTRKSSKGKKDKQSRKSSGKRSSVDSGKVTQGHNGGNSPDSDAQGKTVTEKSNDEKLVAVKSESSDSKASKDSGQKGKNECEKKADTEPTVVKLVSPVKPVKEGEDDGYVGLDYDDMKKSALYNPEVVSSPVKTKSDSGKKIQSKKAELKNMWKSPLSESESSQAMSPKSNNGQFKALQLPRTESDLPRKDSVSSLEESKSEGFVPHSCKEKECSSESLNKAVSAGTPELQKQLSMPCMAIPVESAEAQNSQTSPTAVKEFINDPRSRHSCSDLSSPYEQMNLPNAESLSKQNSSSQQQLAPPPGGQNVPVLNYASLDLGSSEDVGSNEQKVPRAKSRHPSSVSSEESSPSPLSYAQIDFKMSENLRNSAPKESSQVKFSLD